MNVSELEVRSLKLVMMTSELNKAHTTLVRVKSLSYDLDYSNSSLFQKVEDLIKEINYFNSHLLQGADAILVEPSQHNDHPQTIHDTKDEE